MINSFNTNRVMLKELAVFQGCFAIFSVIRSNGNVRRTGIIISVKHEIVSFCICNQRKKGNVKILIIISTSLIFYDLKSGS